MPEISDQDFELFKLHQKVLTGKNRKKALKLFKEEDPTLPIAEVDAESELEARLKPILEENQKLHDEVRQMKAVGDLKETRNKAIDALKNRGHRGTQEELEAIEKIMVEKGITTHASAVEFYDANSKVVAPSATPKTWDKSVTVPLADRFAKGNPTQIARELAAEVINENLSAKR